MNTNKIKDIFKGIGYTFLLFMLYASIPTVISAFLNPIISDETVISFVSNLLFIMGVVYFYRKMFLDSIKDYKNNVSTYLGKSFKYWGIGLAIMMGTNLFINTVIFPGAIANNEEVNRTYLEMNKVIGFIEVGLLAPIIEELIFRYGIRKMTKHKWIYPTISGLVFGVLHALTGIETPLALLYTIPYGALGFMFAYLYNDTDNILTNISMHSLHNIMVYLIVILAL